MVELKENGSEFWVLLGEFLFKDVSLALVEELETFDHPLQFLDNHFLVLDLLLRGWWWWRWSFGLLLSPLVPLCVKLAYWLPTGPSQMAPARHSSQTLHRSRHNSPSPTTPPTPGRLSLRTSPPALSSGTLCTVSEYSPPNPASLTPTTYLLIIHDLVQPDAMLHTRLARPH